MRRLIKTGSAVVLPVAGLILTVTQAPSHHYRSGRIWLCTKTQTVPRHDSDVLISL